MSSKNRSLFAFLVVFFILLSLSSPLFLNTRTVELATSGIYAESPENSLALQTNQANQANQANQTMSRRPMNLPEPPLPWDRVFSWGGEDLHLVQNLVNLENPTNPVNPANPTNPANPADQGPLDHQDGSAPTQSSAGAQSRPARLLAPSAEFLRRDLAQTRFPSVFDDFTVVGYYGNPNSNRMGKLGEYSIPQLAELLQETATVYDSHNDELGVKRAFHLIFATVWPDANLGRLSERRIMEYIDFANENDMIVILDHQIGRFGVGESFREMLPYLTRGNVHLAIDPEWRTLLPGQEIGWVYAQEINQIQEMMQEYLLDHGIYERRMLMVHQFHPKMIQNRDQVRDDFPLVDLVLNADGFGHPALKLSTWRLIAEANNFPLKGFKLFYPKPWKTTGIDVPLMTPEQVMGIVPRPVYINYQ